MKLDPISLQLFIHIVETGTIAGGAARLNIVTSAASKRISELEELLQTPLLRRTNRGVEPTAAGAELEGLARRVLAELDDVQKQIRDFARGVRGHVRLFTNLSPLLEGLPTDLAGFLKRYPEVYVRLEEANTEEVVKAVAGNAADLGISFPMQHTYPVLDVPYHDYRLVVLVPKNHSLVGKTAVSFAETLGFEHIGLQTGSPPNIYMARQAAELGRAIDYRMYVESYHAMALLIAAGLGIAVVPSGLMEPFSREFQVTAIPLDEEWASRELRIYYPARAELRSASQLLLDHLRECAGRAPGP